MSGETPAVREALPVYEVEVLKTERVPPGYRQTEVGVIPEDWEVLPVGSMGEVVAGKALAARAPGLQRPYLRTKNVFDGHIDINDVLSMPMTDAEFARYELRDGDVLLNEGQTLELVGRCSIYQGEFPEPCAIQNQLIRFRARNGVSPMFATHLFRYCQKTGVFAQIALQTTSVAHLGVSRFQRLKLVWPVSQAEQRAIAAALSDVDTLISALDRLIAKKRAVKTAAMQQLLTGKQRLPGFSGEWKTRRLGDLCQIVSGGTPSTSIAAFWIGEIPWCTPTDITENNSKYLSTTNRTISEDGLKYSSAMLLPRGALLLCTRATIGEIKIAVVPVCTNQGFKSLVCGPDASNEFLFYKLVTLKDRLRELGVGSTFLEVSRKDVAALEIPLPKLEEQTAIAAVLSDMDAEISALEARREKTRQVKQGMAQELLTGRTRLV